MNTEKLKSLVEDLIHKESQLQIQTHLIQLNEVLSQLANTPNDASTQVNVSNALAKLDTQVALLEDEFSHTEKEKLLEIGAIDYFGGNLIDFINAKISENAMTPAVVQQSVFHLVEERKAYLDTLSQLLRNLTVLKIESDDLQEGSAEIGFQLPRALFENNLDGLIDELKNIQQIIRAFSELNTGTFENVEVRKISTSDPQFFFGMEVATILSLGVAVNWILEKWKEIEEIRHIRAQTKKTNSFADEEIIEFFDNKIKKMVTEAIDEKANELVQKSKKKVEGRNNEQINHLKWALDSLFARVERGMTVEIKFLPPAVQQDDVEGEKNSKQRVEFANLAEISTNLAFPPPGTHPVLQLPLIKAFDEAKLKTIKPPKPKKAATKKED